MSKALAGVGVATFVGAVALTLGAPADPGPDLGAAAAPASAGLGAGWGEAGHGAAFPAVTTPAAVRRVVAATRAARPEDRPELRRAALGAADPLIAGNAIRALGRLGPIDDDPQLCALLDDSRPRVRQELVLALGQPGRAGAVLLLTRALADQDRTLRCLALFALGRVGTQDARAVLSRVAEMPAASTDERAFARAALR